QAQGSRNFKGFRALAEPRSMLSRRPRSDGDPAMRAPRRAAARSAPLRGYAGTDPKALPMGEAHAFAPTPGSGARGGCRPGNPPATDVRGRADRHATARPAHEFPSPERWPLAARALPRTAVDGRSVGVAGDCGSRATPLDEERVR